MLSLKTDKGGDLIGTLRGVWRCESRDFNPWLNSNNQPSLPFAAKRSLQIYRCQSVRFRKHYLHLSTWCVPFQAVAVSDLAVFRWHSETLVRACYPKMPEHNQHLCVSRAVAVKEEDSLLLAGTNLKVLKLLVLMQCSDNVQTFLLPSFLSFNLFWSSFCDCFLIFFFSHFKWKFSVLLIYVMNQTLWAEEPALPPPPGMHSNFVNPPSLKTLFIAALALMLFLTSAAVGARLVVKIYVIKSMQLEDCQHSSLKHLLRVS